MKNARSGRIAGAFLNLADLVEMAERVSRHENYIFVAGHRADGMHDVARMQVVLAGAQIGNGLFAVRGELIEGFWSEPNCPLGRERSGTCLFVERSAAILRNSTWRSGRTARSDGIAS